MKKSLKHFFYNFTPIAFWIVAWAFFTAYASLKLGYKAINAISLCACGLILCYVLSTFVHELGHVIAAKSAKMKVVKFGFAFFSVILKNSKPSFSFDFRQAGSCAFIPEGTVHSETVEKLAFGGLFASAVFAALCLLALFSKNIYLFCLFGAGGAAAGYIFTVNAMWADKTSDGALLLKGKNEYKSVFAAALSTQKLLLDQSLSDQPIPDIFLKSSEPLALYYAYLFYSAKRDFQSAYKTLERLKGNENNINDNEYQYIFPELIFVSCVEMDDKYLSLRENSIENTFATGDNKSVALLRAHAAYRIFKNDFTWGETLLSTCKNVCKDETGGAKEVDNALIDVLSKFLAQQKQ